MPPPDRAPKPGEVCSHDTGVEVVPPLGVDQPGEIAPEKRGIRDVQVSMALMDEFLKWVFWERQPLSSSASALNACASTPQKVLQEFRQQPCYACAV